MSASGKRLKGINYSAKRLDVFGLNVQEPILTPMLIVHISDVDARIDDDIISSAEKKRLLLVQMPNLPDVFNELGKVHISISEELDIILGLFEAVFGMVFEDDGDFVGVSLSELLESLFPLLDRLLSEYRGLLIHYWDYCFIESNLILLS